MARIAGRSTDEAGWLPALWHASFCLLTGCSPPVFVAGCVQVETGELTVVDNYAPVVTVGQGARHVTIEGIRAGYSYGDGIQVSRAAFPFVQPGRLHQHTAHRSALTHTSV